MFTRILANMGILTIMCECVSSNARTCERGLNSVFARRLRSGFLGAHFGYVLRTQNFSDSELQIDFSFASSCTWMFK